MSSTISVIMRSGMGAPSIVFVALGDEGELAGLSDEGACAVPDFEVFLVEAVDEVVGVDPAGQPARGRTVADVHGEFDSAE